MNKIHKIKVLLIWPKTDPGFYDFSAFTRIIGQTGTFIPLPLITVAAAMGNSLDYTVFDEHVDSIEEQKLSQFDCFLIAANLLQLQSTNRIVDTLRKFNRPIVVGGPLTRTIANNFPSNVTVVEGEIEGVDADDSKGRTVAECLAEDLHNNVLRSEYRAKNHPSLKNFVPPRYDLLDLKKYSHPSIQTSRGCHQICEFCQLVPLYGKHRRKNPELVIEELNLLLVGGKGKTIYIIDDNFSGNLNNKSNRRDLFDLLDQIGKWQSANNYPFDFFVQCSLDVAEYDDVLMALVKAGVNIMFIGIETTDPDTLKAMSKHQNLVLDLNIKVRKLQSLGIGIIVGLIYGFDGDDAKSTERLLTFMEQTAVPVAGVTVLQAPSGTALFKRMQNDGRLSRDPTVLTKSFRSNIIFKLEPKTFYLQYVSLLERLYEPKAYFGRCLRWVSDWNDAYALKYGKRGSISGNLEFKRLFRSVFVQGLTSKYRIIYWKYILLSLIKYRNNTTKLSLSFFLAFFYEVLYKDVHLAKNFVENLPDELEKEFFTFIEKEHKSAI